MLKKLIPPCNCEWEIGDHQKSSLTIPAFLAIDILLLIKVNNDSICRNENILRFYDTRNCKISFICAHPVF